MSVAYGAAKAIVGGAVRSAYTVRGQGLHNIPGAGPAVLAANHLSALDSLFVPLVVPRRVTYLAKAEYWDSWHTRWVMKLTGQIPVQRDGGRLAAAAFGTAVDVLHRGGLLGIYPEGTRSPDGRLYRGKMGLARLAVEAGCAVIPVGLTGTRAIMPKGRRVPRVTGEVTVRFGSPMWAPRNARPRQLRAFVDAVMDAIAAMTGQVSAGGRSLVAV